MLDFWTAFILGVVEGLTEFLPVSSTGHMILVGHMLGFYGDVAETFEISIQLGAILAVLVLYWERVLRMAGLRKQAGAREGGAARAGGVNLLHVLIAIAPVGLIGYLLGDQIGRLFRPETVLVGLVLGGVFMIAAERWKPPVTAETMEMLTYRQAFWIGTAQLLSLWPGFSRSGSTIAGGMLAGASRGAAADFSFIISIPVMGATTGFAILKNLHHLETHMLGFFAVGFAVSFLVAMLAVATFIRWVSKLKLTYFSYYRFVLALVYWLYMRHVNQM